MTRLRGDDAAVLEAPRNLICALGRAEGRGLEADAARRPRRRARGLPLWKRRRRRVRRLECFQLLQRRVALGARGVVVLVDGARPLGRVDGGGVARHFCLPVLLRGGRAAVMLRSKSGDGARARRRRSRRSTWVGRAGWSTTYCARRSPLATVHVARAGFFAGVSMRLVACQSSTTFV